jgi:DNA-binding response OmpR family regulator
MDPTEEFNKLLTKQVLLISSDPECTDRVVRMLEGAGVDVGTAGTPVKAFEILEHGAHHVVFVDADCLGKDTGGFVSQLRKRHPDRIVMVSGARPTNALLIKLIQLF